MIKINLLGVAPPPSKVSSVGGPPAPKATQVMIFVGALVVCFGIVGVILQDLDQPDRGSREDRGTRKRSGRRNWPR